MYVMQAVIASGYNFYQLTPHTKLEHGPINQDNAMSNSQLIQQVFPYRLTIPKSASIYNRSLLWPPAHDRAHDSD